MLRILGSPKKLCGGWTRREMLWAGGLGLFGLGLPDCLGLSHAQASQTRGVPISRSAKAKSCILLYLYGAPSQLETFDPKPDAPLEIRGDLKSIRSNVPGMDVCELLPNVARVMDRVTVVRSLSHPYPIHGVAFALTGTPRIELPMELNPHDGRHWPFIGSVVDYLGRKGGKKPEVPTNLALPFPFSSQRVGEVARAGPYASFLGSAHNPIYTTFQGQATRSVLKTLQEQKVDVADPYLGITHDSRFEVAAATRLPADITLDRLNKRRTLAQQFDQARLDLDNSPAGRAADQHRLTALGLINSTKVRDALDLGKEPMKLRESYGMTIFGQAALTARRLVEAGSRFVTVFWDEYGLAGSAWDTHWDHYPRMKNELLPGLDKALSGLLTDLDSRGLLDETLVLCLSEHGRTPKIDNVKGGGRDHWSRCYSALMAGGGIKRGHVLGKSDKIAGTVAERPVSPKDVLATSYHLLGLDPETTLTDRTGRPIPLVAEGKVLNEIIQ
ncbi:MAG: DUF1501 domain-containing protein [Gemmataceae bacterium]